MCFFSRGTLECKLNVIILKISKSEGRMPRFRTPNVIIRSFAWFCWRRYRKTTAFFILRNNKFFMDNLQYFIFRRWHSVTNNFNNFILEIRKKATGSWQRISKTVRCLLVNGQKLSSWITRHPIWSTYHI